MNKFNLKTILLPMLLIAVTLSSCEAIAGIFKAGVWFGVIGVVVIIVIIFWLISKAGKK
ncbi:MAG TPA: phosphatidate cytidylyltransferase [Ginsengibacter sp.]